MLTCFYVLTYNQGLIARERGHATLSMANTIFSNTKLGEISKFSVYFPSKLKVQVLMLLSLVTLFYFTVYTVTAGVACPLSLGHLVLLKNLMKLYSTCVLVIPTTIYGISVYYLLQI